jgi:hypothetical protein
MSDILYVMSMQPIVEGETLPLHKKIGITNNTLVRATQLATKMPFTMYVEHAWEIPDGRASELESALHSLLAASNINGEWFKDPEESLVDGLTRVLRFMNARPITDTKLDEEDDSRAELEQRYKQTGDNIRTLLGAVEPLSAGWNAQEPRAVDQRFVKDGATVYVQPNSSGAILVAAGRNNVASQWLKNAFGSRVQHSEYASGQTRDGVTVSAEELRQFFSPIPAFESDGSA